MTAESKAKKAGSKSSYGVHSEVGTLRKVLVCAPGLGHTRLTPSNNDDLLFDDVLWVQTAKRDHFDFMTKMRERGVEVVEMHNLLAEFLIGGVSVVDIPDAFATSDYLDLVRESHGVTEYLLPPLPNTLYTRDTTCWIYGGVTLNPLYWPVRREETLLTTAIYRFHPSFADADVQVWWGDPDQNFGLATLEGGDVMPVGNWAAAIGAVCPWNPVPGRAGFEAGY